MAKIIRIFIIETAVSQAPKRWLSHSIIANYYSKYQRLPLIDASIHQHLLKNIKREERFDRPDILHFGLLTALGYSKIIPNLEIYFNLREKIYNIDITARIPRDQKRFFGILETIIEGKYKGNLITESDQYDKKSFENEGYAIISRKGEKGSIKEAESYNLVFGGFAFGEFKTNFHKNNKVYSLSDNSLDLWTSISYSINSLFPDR